MEEHKREMNAIKDILRQLNEVELVEVKGIIETFLSKHQRELEEEYKKRIDRIYEEMKIGTNFDYGEKTNGQYQHHPVNLEGKYIAPIRNWYKHTKCGISTWMNKEIAETYAKHSGAEFYSKTFCAGCEDYFPLNEFLWIENGKTTAKKLGIVYAEDELRAGVKL